jgi:raffinose/stachyose/melibiose transport system permease protein
MLPAILLILFVFLLPFLASIYISLTDWNGMGWNMRFIGLKNFMNIFLGRNIWDILVNNFKYFIILVFVQNFAAVIIAIILNVRFKGRDFFRALIFLPTIISAVAVSFVWTLIYDPIYGPLPAVSTFLHLPFLANSTWLGDPNIAIYLIAFVSLWQWTGWNMVVYFAGLQSIPGELYESADMDGASALQQFRHITIPMLAPAITINLVVSTIGVLKIFDLPFVMTNGGPGHTTETLAITIYNESFLANKIGYGTALSLVLFIMVLLISSLQTIYLRKREANITG